MKVKRHVTFTTSAGRRESHKTVSYGAFMAAVAVLAFLLIAAGVVSGWLSAQ